MQTERPPIEIAPFFVFIELLLRGGRRGFPLFQYLREYDQKDGGAQNRGKVVRLGLSVEHRLRAPEDGQYDETAEENDELARQRQGDGILRLPQSGQPVHERVLEGEGNHAEHEHPNPPNAALGDLRVRGEQRNEGARREQG